MADNKSAIIVKDVYKTFKLPHEQHSGLKQVVINIFNRKSGYETQKILENISFEIKKGEFFGIVGKNGSGKSTLLKLLAGIYVPDKGLVQVNGSLTPFIELGVGFNPELTGRENVFLNGALLGFDHDEMEEMYEDIIEFAELEKFMDQKLKNYSSGMQVRLAFSIAIRAQSDILLIDEVLAVGDVAFQQKCFKYFNKLKKQSKTVILVTHDMVAFEKYCDRGILIDSGNVIYRGDPLLLGAEYEILNSNNITKSVDKGVELSFDNSIVSTKLNGENKTILNKGDDLEVIINVISKRTIDAVVVGVSIVRSDGLYIAFHNSYKDLERIKLKKGSSHEFVYKFESSQLMPGAYSIDVALYDDNNHYIDLKPKAGTFVITGEDKTRFGVVKIIGKWNFK